MSALFAVALKVTLLAVGALFLLLTGDAEVKHTLKRRIRHLPSVFTKIIGEGFYVTLGVARYFALSFVCYQTVLSVLEGSNAGYAEMLKEYKWFTIGALFVFLVVFVFFTVINYYFLKAVVRLSALLINASAFLRHAIESMARSPSRDGRRGQLQSSLLLKVGSKLAIIFGVTLFSASATLGWAWYRLGAGPVYLDFATPFIKRAIDEKLGSRYVVNVGGLQLERDRGYISLRLRDVTIHDSDGGILASAPKVEVSLSSIALLSGHFRAETLNMVGAELALRIERDGSVSLFADARKRAIAVASLPFARLSGPPSKKLNHSLPKNAGDFANSLTVIADVASAVALGDRGLRELGIKKGKLTVEDLGTGRRWQFDQINVSLVRPTQGGLSFVLGSDNKSRPWELSAAMRPLGDGVRAFGIEARDVWANDILLAMQLNGAPIDAELPVSGSVRAELSRSGALQRLQGHITASRGPVSGRGQDKYNVRIERADIRFNWDPGAHVLVMPFQIKAGGNQFTMRANLHAPTDESGIWRFNVVRDDTVIDPIILAAIDKPEGKNFALNRLNMEGRIDTKRSRIDLDKGDLSRVDSRPLYNVGLAVTGSVDHSLAESKLALGVAGETIPIDVAIGVWPVFVQPTLHSWIVKHVTSGSIDRMTMAVNSPIANIVRHDNSVTDEHMSLDISAAELTLQPFEGLPPLEHLDLAIQATERDAIINGGRGVINFSSNDKLTIDNVVLRISKSDTEGNAWFGDLSFRIQGQASAVAALLKTPLLYPCSQSIKLNSPVAGSVSAGVFLKFPLNGGLVSFDVNADISRLVMKEFERKRIEAQLLQVHAANQIYQIRGQASIDGVLSKIDTEGRLPSSCQRF